MKIRYPSCTLRNFSFECFIDMKNKAIDCVIVHMPFFFGKQSSNKTMRDDGLV
jgi:hypothetical protein